MSFISKLIRLVCRKSNSTVGHNLLIENDNSRNTQHTRRPPSVSESSTSQRTSRSGRVPPTPEQVTNPAPSAPPEDAFIEEIMAYIADQLAESTPEEHTPHSSPKPQQEHPKLEDFGSTDDLKQLNVRQLKILLTINRVDFRGCIEKSELLEKVERLWQDNNQHRDIPENTPTGELCKLCMDAPLDCVLLECGHIASCLDCGKRLAECPICRQYVVRVVRTFKA